MPTIMPDNDVRGHFQLLLRICGNEEWREVWDQLNVEIESFRGIGLPDDVSDRDLWLACQQRGIVLVTGNRNAEDRESLEATIEELGSPASLPVLTIGRPQRIYASPVYAELVAVRMMECLIDVGQLLGSGRQYLP